MHCFPCDVRRHSTLSQTIPRSKKDRSGVRSLLPATLRRTQRLALQTQLLKYAVSRYYTRSVTIPNFLSCLTRTKVTPLYRTLSLKSATMPAGRQEAAQPLSAINLTLFFFCTLQTLTSVIQNEEAFLYLSQGARAEEKG